MIQFSHIIYVVDEVLNQRERSWKL